MEKSRGTRVGGVATIPYMDFRTRNLRYWVFRPSEYVFSGPRTCNKAMPHRGELV